MNVRPALPLSLRLGYGLGASAEGVKSNSFAVFLLFYYQQVLKLEPWLAGLALLLALMVDALVDPFIGVWSDSLRTRLGRRLPFLYAASVPYGVFFYAVFMPPHGLGQFPLFLWLLVNVVGARCASSVFDIPHQSLSAELTNDYDERAALLTWRMVFPWFFGLTNILLMYQVFVRDTPEYPQGMLNPGGYAGLAIWGAAAVMLTTFLSAVLIRRAVLAAEPPADRVPAASFQRLWLDIRVAMRNRSYRNVILAGLCVQVGFGMSENLGLYLNTLFWGLNTDQLSVFIVLIMGSTLLALALSRRLVVRFDKRRVAIACAMTVVGLRVLGTGLRLVGVLPGGGEPVVFAVLLPTVFVEYTAIIITMTMIVAMIADTTDEHELSTGRRQEGLLFSANNFLGQAATGLGSFLAGLVISFAGIPAEAKRSEMPTEPIWLLGAVALTFMAVFFSGAAFCFSRYALSRSRHAAIRLELQSRKLMVATGAT